MSGDVVNLKRWRKAAVRVARRSQAAANRLKFGRPKAERQRDAIEIDQRTRVLDAARREAPSLDRDPDPTS